MAKRWYTQFTDRMGRSCEFAIYDSVYAGAATYVDAGPVPVTITWMAQGDDKYAPIKASELKANLLTTTSLQYLDVFAYANKRFSCALIIDETVVWAGYAAPEYYTEPFIHTPYLTTITFTDGLVELKNKQFTPPGYVSTDWRQSLIWYIKAALNEINLQLPIYAAIDLDYYEADLDIVTDRVLEKLNIDWRSIRNDDGTFVTWYDALNNVLTTLNARLYQNNGAWIVENIDQKSDTYRVEKYAYTGIYDSTVAAQDDRVALTAWSAGNVIRFVNTPAQLEVSPQMKQFKVMQEYGNRRNLLNFNNYNGNFNADEWLTIYDLRYWTRYGGVAIKHEPDWNALRISQYFPAESGTPSKYIDSDIIDLDDVGVFNYSSLMDAWESSDIVLKVEFSIADNVGSLTYTEFLIDFDSTTYYLNETGVAGETGDAELITDTSRIISTCEKGEWKDLTFTVRKPPTAEIGSTPSDIKFLMRCYQAVNTDPLTVDDGVMYRNMRVYFTAGLEDTTLSREAREIYSRETTYTIDDDNLLEPSAYEVLYGETPAPYGSYSVGDEGGWKLINKYVLIDDNGDAINYFSEHGKGSFHGLIFGINREALHNTYRQAMIKLRGTILDETNALSFRSVLQDYDSRLYIPISLTWDVQQCMWDGEWLNFHPSTMMGDFNSDFGEDFFID